jgi:hypothetical protein
VTLLKWQGDYVRKVPDVIPERVHGTVNGYVNYKCRCVPCSGAMRTYRKEWSKNNKSRLGGAARIRSKKEKVIFHFGGRCVKCGYDRSTKALVFHGAGRVEWKRAWHIVISQLEMATLVCLNCNAELEHITETIG